MKYKLLPLLLLFFSISVNAQQLKVPTLSPAAEIKQEIGLTEISLSYARPSAKGRKVFGNLVPFGEMWRTGANASTKLTVSEAINIGGQALPAGTYAIYTIPEEKEWTIIIHKKTNFRSISGNRVKPENDACRFTIVPTENPLAVETFTIQFTDLHTKGCTIQLAWENTLVNIPIELPVDEQVAQQMATLLENPEAIAHRDYFRAAEYYLHNGKDLAQAQEWIDAALVKSEKNFRYGLLKAKIYEAEGKKDLAIKAVTTANQWATVAENDNYIGQTKLYLDGLLKSNKKQLPKATLASISGQELLQKSIQYHDPNNKWPSFNGTFYLAQMRPNNPKTDTSIVMLDLPNSYFKAVDNRGGNSIMREVDGSTCQTSLNGSTSISEADQKKFRLTCERAKMYRDYFSYLYGLPMKLKDPGTIIDPKIYHTSFQGKDCLSMRVTYDEEVGDDIWYFYFHPTSYALIGYRFYHEEAKNDGEYITLDGEAMIEDIKIPKDRHWYYNIDDKLLGADLLFVKP